jgi:hypothetical protein
VDGQVPPDPRGEIFGLYQAADGRWIHSTALCPTAPHLPNMPRLVIDTGLGKLAVSLDLRQADDRLNGRDAAR